MTKYRVRLEGWKTITPTAFAEAITEHESIKAQYAFDEGCSCKPNTRVVSPDWRAIYEFMKDGLTRDEAQELIITWKTIVLDHGLIEGITNIEPYEEL